MSTIALLILPYIVIATRYRKTATILSALGLIFGTAFIGFEVSARPRIFEMPNSLLAM